MAGGFSSRAEVIIWQTLSRLYRGNVPTIPTMSRLYPLKKLDLTLPEQNEKRTTSRKRKKI